MGNCCSRAPRETAEVFQRQPSQGRLTMISRPMQIPMAPETVTSWRTLITQVGRYFIESVPPNSAQVPEAEEGPLPQVPYQVIIVTRYILVSDQFPIDTESSEESDGTVADERTQPAPPVPKASTPDILISTQIFP